MSNVAFDDQVSWEEAVEKQRHEFEELNRPYELKRQQEERLKAEQEAIRAKRQLELFVAKSTLPFSEPLAALRSGFVRARTSLPSTGTQSTTA